MKLSKSYLTNLIGVAIIIGAIFIAVVLGNSLFNIVQLEFLYILIGLYAGAIGFLEIADLVKLGFGMTRFSIYRKFTMTIVLVDGLMLLITIFFVGFSKLADSSINILTFFDYRLVIYFSLIIYFLGQLGMFLGNIRFPDYLKLIIFAFIIVIIGIVVDIQKKFLINSLLILFSVGLSIANFIIIRNIKLEINL